MIAFTARIGSGDPDEVNIAAKGGVAAFAPSWPLLKPLLALREQGKLTDRAWLEYTRKYTAEMRASYRRDRAPWDALLERPRAVLVCYCTDATRCHRTILARDILGKLGATYMGEMVE